MRRYLVFAGSRRCTFGGWGDYKNDHDSREEAEHAARTLLKWCDWAELVDLQTVLLFFMLAGFNQPMNPAPDPERTARYTDYFNEADTNADGVIDEGEIDAVTAADFESMDVNGDEIITIDDIYNEVQGEPDGAARNLDLSSHLPFDANSDGSITREEYEAYLDAELLAEMDGNGDGRISLGEYRAYEEF